MPAVLSATVKTVVQLAVIALLLCTPRDVHGSATASPGSLQEARLSVLSAHQRVILRTVLPWTAHQVAADTLGLSQLDEAALKVTVLARGMRMDSIEIIGNISMDRQTFLSKLKQHPGVEFAHPDRTRKTNRSHRLLQQAPQSPEVGFDGSLDPSTANVTVNTSDYEAPQVRSDNRMCCIALVWS